MIIITAESYPSIYRAFKEIELDNGGWVQSQWSVPDAYSSQIPVVEKQLAGLTDAEMEIICAGEQTDMDALVEEKKIEEANRFLNHFFDDWQVDDTQSN